MKTIPRIPTRRSLFRRAIRAMERSWLAVFLFYAIVATALVVVNLWSQP